MTEDAQMAPTFDISRIAVLMIALLMAVMWVLAIANLVMIQIRRRRKLEQGGFEVVMKRGSEELPEAKKD